MILDTIVSATKIRIEKEKQEIPLDTIKELAQKIPRLENYPFEDTLRKDFFHFICEIKKASPSKGVIAEDFPYLAIAREYEEAGASCISVLTEPDFFLGKDIYLTEIRKTVTLPLLRKDFILEPYQIYQAKVIGADAILLICSILNDKELTDYLNLCKYLGLSALVEAHDKVEVKRAVHAGASIVGVNNRNLKTFDVDVTLSTTLRKFAPDNILFVAESGIKTAEDIRILKENKVNAALIGETFMRTSDKKQKLTELRGEAINGKS